ncbi:MAG: hypothetical protein LBU08_04405 [Tannerellaceae bacterium]|nr:hypothetical protein [Tannerellaceae bacterium]
MPFSTFVKPSFFYNCSGKSDTCCFVLSGYKEYLWDTVFDRLKRFVPENVDVCIVSSGLFSEKLYAIAKENKWSYLCTKRNSVTLAMNTAIRAFPRVENIYKVDEDIFLTRNFFTKLRECYARCEKESDYFPAFVAPLIPVNGYGHLRILTHYGLVEEYASLFEKPRYTVGGDRMIEGNSESAIYMWKEGGIPHIDILDAELGEKEFSFTPCPIRFSIGAIFFKRSLWEEMKYFQVDRTTGLGEDEIQLCSLRMFPSRAIIVCENTAVGHLSFGPQNAAMKEYFLSQPERFGIAAQGRV